MSFLHQEQDDKLDSMKRLGILFGSFNPLHNGHIDVAKKTLTEVHLDEVWFVIQPSNNYKPVQEFLDYATRKTLLEEALETEPDMHVYEPTTADYAHFIPETLKEITDCEITLILGADLSSSLKDWPDYAEITALAKIYTSPRLDHISSGMVRDKLTAGEPISDFVPDVVANYLAQLRQIS